MRTSHYFTRILHAPARLALCLLALALLCPLAAIADTTIDTTASVGGTASPFGNPPYSPTYGQVITVPAGENFLQSFTFNVQVNDAPLTLRGKVYAWSGSAVTGPALFSTGPITLPADPNYVPVTINMNNLPVTPGQQYILLFTTLDDLAASPGSAAAFQTTNPGTYAGGNFAFNNGADLSMNWEFRPYDLAFTAVLTSDRVLANPAVSDQKAGSVLVFPYYNSSPTGTTADTLIQISNVCNGTSVSGGVPNYSYLHLFFMKGCSPADTYACLTPNGSLNILASVYDPGVEGYLIAVAVDANGVPVQNNCFIGSAYVRDDNTGFADSYGAESFWKNTPGSVAVTSGYAAINLNGTDYDAAPTQFSVQVQDPAIADEYVVLASVSGNLGSSLASVSQSGFGIVYRADETPASFQPQLNSGCLSITLIDAGKIRVATQNGGYNNFLKDSYGYLKFNVTSPAVGLLISKQGAAGQPINRFSGIRTLHKTQVGSATLSLPVFPPFCF